jgi:hypothetical protein
MSSGTDGPRSAKQTAGPDQFSGGWTSFGSGTPRVLALVTPWEEEWRLHSIETALKGPEMPFKILGIWTKDNPLGLAVNIPPMVIEIKPGVTPIRVTIPNPNEGTRRDISSPLETLNYGILRPC